LMAFLFPYVMSRGESLIPPQGDMS
jgi:hypothetical protein